MDNFHISKLLKRSESIIKPDMIARSAEIDRLVKKSDFLVIGGAGSIGQAVVENLFKRAPKSLHVVDISENNLVEIVRHLRSSIGYTTSDFQTFALDCGSQEFEAFVNQGRGYDYVLNLSAMKHVRSEKDPFSIMRMIDTNITNALKVIELLNRKRDTKYFCVSTDKAANPVNIMGATKRIMELFLMRDSDTLSVSMARFANVAFSDGSLLHGFNQRINKQQPISVPNDVKRYFITPKESGELCLLSCLLGENQDIFFPKLSDKIKLTGFKEILEGFLHNIGREPQYFETEDEARDNLATITETSKWPCFQFESDTSGEKEFEEFFTDNETLDMESFISVGVIKKSLSYDLQNLDRFTKRLDDIRSMPNWNKSDIVQAFDLVLDNFSHLETGKSLNERM